jgi:hypothetical protein
MFRKITTIAAAALAIGSLTIAPRVAEATGGNIHVSAAVPSTESLGSFTQPTLSPWDGSAVSIPFGFSVTTNDGKGYTLTFSDGNSTAFAVAGTRINTNTDSFTITGVTAGGAPDTQTYPHNAPGTIVGVSDTPGTIAYTFTANLSQYTAAPYDVYTDDVTAAVTPTL